VSVGVSVGAGVEVSVKVGADVKVSVAAGLVDVLAGLGEGDAGAGSTALLKLQASVVRIRNIGRKYF